MVVKYSIWLELFFGFAGAAVGTGFVQQGVTTPQKVTCFCLSVECLATTREDKNLFLATLHRVSSGSE